MFKFLFILIVLCVAGFLMMPDVGIITVTAFGFRITTSILIVIAALAVVLYLWHLLKQPFLWLSGCQTWYQKRKQSQKEAYLLLALKTVLDQDSVAKNQLLKKKNTFFDKKSDENFIIEALFQPSPHTFEQLLHRPETELAGIHGLLGYAQKAGDWLETARLLQKAHDKNPNEPWVTKELWQAQILQSDWAASLKTLDVLKKQDLINKDEFRDRKAQILIKLGRVKEAYKLAPTRPEVALAYAKADPKKAKDIIEDLWPRNPSRDAFLLFQRAIAGDKPIAQEKAVRKLVRHNPEAKQSLLALAETATDLEKWGDVKEYLTTYLSLYPLTVTVARMMAQAERCGWHHEEAAKDWEIKTRFARDEDGWGCSACGHKTEEWDIRCPKCNAFGTIRYQ